MTKGSNVVPPIHVWEKIVAPFAVCQKTLIQISTDELVIQPIEPQQMIGDSLGRIMFGGPGFDEKRPVTRLGEKELARDPSLYGKVTVQFVIDGTGRVADALVHETSMGSEPVESCIVGHVRRWTFPAPQGGSTVQVTYPYVFRSSSQ